MIISKHLKNNTYKPDMTWPESAIVQWGDRGVVFSKTGNYSTAFFEVSMDDTPNFLRGEGKTILDAEKNAFKKYKKSKKCKTHVFSRARRKEDGSIFNYINGSGFCIKCDSFSSDQFHPITKLGKWKEMISSTELSNISQGYIFPDSVFDYKGTRRLELRAKMFNIKIPKWEFYVNDKIDEFDDIPLNYKKDCFNACVDFFTLKEYELKSNNNSIVESLILGSGLYDIKEEVKKRSLNKQ